MEQDPQKAVETAIEQQKKVPGVPFVKDDPRINREGRPKGTRDFATDFDEVVEEIAAENGITKSQARKHLLKVAYKNAKEGNYSFYKDIHDRYYGTATNKTDITTAGLPLILPSELINKNDTTSKPEVSS